MKIHLEKDEIKKALTEYVSNQGINLMGKSVEITLKAGRGTKGHYADIDIMDIEASDDKENPNNDGDTQAITFQDFEQTDD